MPSRLLILLLAVALSLGGCARRSQTPGACNLPARTKEAVPRFVHSGSVHYLQRDQRWASEPIGGSGKTLGAVGCTVCCVSMALAQQGVDLPPATLNRQMIRANGFTPQGWLHWPTVAAATGGRADARIVWHPTTRAINTALAEGTPVVVKVAPPPMKQHWVLLVGRDGHDYLMRDPLADREIIQPLSILRSPILAARVVKRTNR